MPQSEEMKACPFCGGKAAVSDGNNGLHFRVICNEKGCRAAGPLERCAIDAKDAWNRRPTPAPDLREVLEEVFDFLGGCDGASELRGRILSAIWMEAALSASPVGEGWQPIETAPKDGTIIDLWGSCNDGDGRWTGRFPDCMWSTLISGSGKFAGWMDSTGMVMESPEYGAVLTHWRPLPDPPAMQSGKQGE